MARTIEVLAGDLPKGSWQYSGFLGQSTMTVLLPGLFKCATVDLKQDLERVEMQNEESLKKMGGTLGWGLVGAALLGPLGAIGGLLVGGRGKEILFAAYLKDGRKFLGKTDGKTWEILSALTFK